MKKILIIIFVFLSNNSFAIDKSTSFTNEIFQKAQSEGKTVVINSWNKFCFTCSKQTKVLNQVEKEFKDVLFLSFEQTKNKDIAQFLKIDYWTTIVIYKDNKETYRSMGVTNKSEIYSAIKSNT
jgi:thiol-disulfide isomerase/thioredoxin|tara:strand:- start:3969 stop:4340 length:372 start_codon:yes stop_codon:yes gene_type:complete